MPDSEIAQLRDDLSRLEKSIQDTVIPSLHTALNAVLLAKSVLEATIADRDRLATRIRVLEGKS